MQELFLHKIDILKKENEKERERAEQERIAREHAENEVKRLQKLLELEKNK